MNIDMSDFPNRLINNCKDTHTLLHKEEIVKPDTNLHAFSTFDALLEDCISFMINNCGKVNYVQCAAI